MVDGLTGIVITIKYRTVPSFVDSELLSYALGHLKQLAQHGLVSFVKIVERRNVLFGDNEHMHWRNGPYVLERHNMVVLVHYLCGRGVLRDLAKDT